MFKSKQPVKRLSKCGSIGQVVKEMDNLYQTSFEDFLIDERNAALIASRLGKMQEEYPTEKLIFVCIYLSKRWSLDALSKFLTALLIQMDAETRRKFSDSIHEEFEKRMNRA